MADLFQNSLFLIIRERKVVPGKLITFLRERKIIPGNKLYFYENENSSQDKYITFIPERIIFI